MKPKPTRAPRSAADLLIRPSAPFSAPSRNQSVGRFFNGVPIDLRSTYGDQEPPISHRRQPSRDCEGAAQSIANFNRFFNGVPMGLRRTNDDENALPTESFANPNANWGHSGGVCLPRPSDPQACPHFALRTATTSLPTTQCFSRECLWACGPPMVMKILPLQRTPPAEPLLPRSGNERPTSTGF